MLMPAHILHGRERRRKGLVNHLRRLSYGLALMLVMPFTHAQEPRAEPARKTKISPWMRAQQLLPSWNNAASAMRVRIAAENSGEFLRLDLSTTAPVSKGLGLALDMSDMGQLYVNVYCPYDAKGSGAWKISGGDPLLEAPLSRHEEWKLLRGAREENPDLLLSPQLVVHLDEMVGAPRKMEARLQYAPWSSVVDRPGGDRRVPQLSVHWPF